jgi:hypothetical protein
MGNWIYWTLTDPWLQAIITVSLIHTLYSSLGHTLKSSQFAMSSPDFPSRCLVAASNDGRSPSPGFPNSPRSQLPDSNRNSSQRLNSSSSLTHYRQTLHYLQWLNSLLTVLLQTSRHGPHGKHRSSVAVYGPLPSNDRCLVVCFAVVA